MTSKIIEFLNVTFSDDGYLVKEFSENLFFGKDQNDDYICARKTTSKSAPFSMRTQTIHLFQNHSLELIVSGNSICDTYDLIVLKKSSSKNLETFINLCLNFYNNDTNGEIINLTEDLIDLFKTPESNNKEFEQGLWAELFLIHFIYEKFSVNIVPFWHTDEYMKYDFSIDNNKKIEVKSTTKENRVHKFSHSQVYTKNKVNIASIMMRKDDAGLNIIDIFEKTEELFSNNYEKFSLIQKQLYKLNLDSIDRFDYNYSIENIKFYLNFDVPRFEMAEPSGVFHTKYDIDLENVFSISEKDFLNNF